MQSDRTAEDLGWKRVLLIVFVALTALFALLPSIVEGTGGRMPESVKHACLSLLLVFLVIDFGLLHEVRKQEVQQEEPQSG